MMKEYKRCKYCSMEMDKSAIKCPHCNKVQVTKFSIGKSENLVIAILIIVAIIVGIYSKFSNIQNSLASVTNFFETSELLQDVSNEAQKIISFFDDNEDYNDDYEDYVEVYAEDLAYDFEDDYDAAYDYYCDSTIEMTGQIKKIERDSNGIYLYLDTYDSEYSICICISANDTDDVDYANSLETDDYITYMGDIYIDDSSEYELYFINGYIVY